MAQQGSKQPAPAALAVQHLARAGAAAGSPALSAVLGRRMLQVAASTGLGLPRGVARPCPHCGTFNAEGNSSQVQKLPRRAVRRELQQQAAAQARGHGSGQPISRWVSESTCSVCGQEVRRRLQHPPSQQQQQQQQQQPQVAVGKAAAHQQLQAVQQRQQQQGEVHQQGQQQQESLPQQQPPQELEQLVNQQSGKEHVRSSQGKEQVQLALQQAEQQQGSQPEWQPDQTEPLSEPAEQQAPAAKREEGCSGSQPSALAWAAVQQAWGLQPNRTEGQQGAELPAALLPAAAAAPAAEDAGEAGGVGSAGDAAAMPGSLEGTGPPCKRRRLSWSDQLQQVKVIDRAPRPQLRKVYSWHRLARSWKAATFKLG